VEGFGNNLALRITWRHQSLNKGGVIQNLSLLSVPPLLKFELLNSLIPFFELGLAPDK
jgi:hypothetical protein